MALLVREAAVGRVEEEVAAAAAVDLAVADLAAGVAARSTLETRPLTATT